MTPDPKEPLRESERLEQEFRNIHNECKGRPIKALKATPRATRVLRALFFAYLEEGRR